MQADGAGTARGALAWLLRWRWALTAVRDVPRLTLARLEYVGCAALAAAERRAAAQGEAARARRAACRDVRGPYRGPARAFRE